MSGDIYLAECLCINGIKVERKFNILVNWELPGHLTSGTSDTIVVEGCAGGGETSHQTRWAVGGNQWTDQMDCGGTKTVVRPDSKRWTVSSC
jgi:hypothetical protein